MTDPQLDIDTGGGIVRGRRVDSPDGAARAWLGIPYAAPPVGALRWRAPEPPAPWRGVRDATRFGADSVQAPMPASRAPAQGEDCLMLNVWAPAEPAAAPLPVLVWVHGGGFVGGSGADACCDGARLAAAGAVVVTFNYRAGLFGFLAHPELSAETPQRTSGNYGLLDQIQALRWLRDRIHRFGGDPDTVTVFGVSAGSASLSLLLTSPEAAGLFQRAILHSPGAGRPLAALADAEQAGLRLGHDLEALRRLPAAEVLARTSLLTPKVRGLTTARVLRPIRDGWLLTEDERAAFAAGRIHPMPMIVGTNVDEGTTLTAAWPVDTLAAYHEIVDNNFGDAVAEALALYPATSDREARPRVAEMFADTQFNYGARLLARTARRRGSPVWRYLFARRRPGQGDGPHHGDEVAYAFGNLDAHRAGPTGARHDAIDAAVSAAMRSAWLAFARGGDPNVPGLVDWPADVGGDDLALRFDDRGGLESGWRREQLDFLDRYSART